MQTVTSYYAFDNVTDNIFVKVQFSSVKFR